MGHLTLQKRCERPLNAPDTATVEKKSLFILSDESEFDMIDILSIAVHTLARRILTSLSEDKILLMRYVIFSLIFKGLSLRMDKNHML